MTGDTGKAIRRHQPGFLTRPLVAIGNIFAVNGLLHYFHYIIIADCA